MVDFLLGVFSFALMPGPAMEEKQFRLPDHFFEAYFTFLSSLCDPASGFPRFFEFHNTDGPLSGDREHNYGHKCGAKKFNQFSFL